GIKFGFSDYEWLICALVVLYYFNPLFLNLFRIDGRITEIMLNQSLPPLMTLIVLLIFHSEQLVLYSALLAVLFSLATSFVVYFLRSPISIKLDFDLSVSKGMMLKGFYLFIYSMSFYFILISSRTFVSQLYSIQEFGYFTFS